MIAIFEMNLDEIQPSQLYISRKKMLEVQKAFDKLERESIGIIPIKKLENDIIFIDGHTRALVAYLEGLEVINVVWETEELDWEMYTQCVQWCKDAEIYSIADLQKRIIPHDDYEVLWHKRCKDMQNTILEKRKKEVK